MATLLSIDDLINQPDDAEGADSGGSVDLLSVDDLIGIETISGDDLVSQTTAIEGEFQTQDVIEVGKGIPSGAVRTFGVAAKGAAAATSAGKRMRQYLIGLQDVGDYTPEQITQLRKNALADPELSPSERGAFQAALTDVLEDPGSLSEILAGFPAAPESGLYKTGEKIEQYGRTILPAEPGFEDSIGRQLGEGLGSVAAGAATSAMTGPFGSGALFGLMGAGEAFDRAIQDGATEEQALQAARLGLGPGLTDSLPVETLLGRVPIPGGRFLKIPANVLGKVIKRVARVGYQAFIEGLQEGGQEFLQNFIEQATRNPDQDLGEGVLPSAGIGSGTGALAETGRQLITGFAGRRKRSAPPGVVETSRANRAPLTQEDLDSPIPNDILQEGKDVLAEADAIQPANDILRRNGLPDVGSRVSVDRGGEVISGEVADSFTERNDELGLEEDGIRITLDDGTTFEEFVSDFERFGINVTPEGQVQPQVPEEPGQTTEITGNGDRTDPVITETIEGVDIAGEQVAEPTEGQKEAGNYKKGHVRYKGFDITIENPIGSTRSGTDTDGTPWEVEMTAHYGYIKRTEGADGEQVDVYIGLDDNAQSVFVVDQIDPATGEFDEHKAVMGATNLNDANFVYDAHFSDGSGPNRRGAVTEMDIEDFRAWVTGSDASVPVAYERASDFIPEEPVIEEGDGIESDLSETAPDTFTAEELAADEGTGAEEDSDLHTRHDDLFRRISAAEKTPDTEPFSPESERLFEEWKNGGDWKAFSRSRGYTDEEIADFEQWLAVSEEYDAKFGEGASQERVKEIEDEGVGEENLSALEALGARSDIPNAEWLAQKQREAEEDEADSKRKDGFTGHGLNGPVTADVARVILPTSVVNSLPGLNGEETDRGPGTIKGRQLLKSMQERGYDEGRGGTIFVAVNHRGESFIAEGNNRTAVADHLNIGQLPVNVRYFNGGELADGPFSPANVLKNRVEEEPQTEDESEQDIEEPEVGEGDTVTEEETETDETDIETEPEAETEPDAEPEAETQAEADTESEEAPEEPDTDTDTGEGVPGEGAGTGSGSRRKRLGDVGEKMPGKRADQYEKLTDGAEDGSSEELDRILKLTEKAKLFPVRPGEGATVGAKTAIELLRSGLPGFTTYAGHISGGRRGGWNSSYSEALRGLDFSEGTESRTDLHQIAADYIATVSEVSALVDGATSVKQVADLLKEVAFGLDPAEVSEKGLSTALYDVRKTAPDLGRSISFLMEKRPITGSRFDHFYYWEPYKLIRRIERTDEDSEGSNSKMLRRPRVPVIEREGLPDYRNGRDVSPQELMDKFGFRGVEFGNWVSGGEGQAAVNYAYDALHDLAEHLGADPKAISLGGTLGLAFGSRGRGRHAAHYEPDNIVINLTKTSGDGTIAHEWGHALDYHLSKTAEGKKAVEDFKSVLQVKYDVEAVNERIDDFLAGRSYYQGMKREGPVEMARFWIEANKRGGRHYRLNTEFKKDADKLGKSYWGKPEELWARAFEASAYDLIDGSTPYLVTEWVSEGFVSSETGYRGMPYPEKDERAKFNEYHQHFIDGIEWTADGPRMKAGYELIQEPNRQSFIEALNKLEEELPARHEFIKRKKEPEKAEATSTPMTDLTAYVAAKLAQGEKITPEDLFNQAAQYFGGTAAEGKFTPRQAYDALEAGMNTFIGRSNDFSPLVDAAQAKEQVGKLAELTELLPNQSRRTADTEDFQQFSTPPAYSYVAAWVANLNSGDILIEPSAGTGNLAVYGKKASVEKTVVNELGTVRADLLRLQRFDVVYEEDAAQLNNIVKEKATVVLMNPPFSRTAGRTEGKDTSVAGKHIEQAFLRLEQGGRLVVIAGKGMAPLGTRWKELTKKLGNTATVRANVGINGSIYRKFGTTFDTRLIVIDKIAPPEGHKPVFGDAESSLTGAIDKLAEVRNERPEAQRTSDQSEGAATDDAVDLGDQPGTPDGGATADTSSGGRSGGRSDSGPTEPEPGQGDGNADRGPDAGTDDRGAGRGGVSDSGPAGDRGTDIGVRADPVDVEFTEGLFAPYKPQRIDIPGAQPHPEKLVQTAAMAAVNPPVPSYIPNLPKETITEGRLSEIQLEAVIYAGESHSKMLPHVDGEPEFRRGFFVGDGTGVGKGREAAGIILDNWRQGRHKAVWLTKNDKELLSAAKRDIEGVLGDPKWARTLPAAKDKDGNVNDLTGDGVVVVSYDKLRNGNRRAQITKWLGEDFDGVIVFDEAHKMGNAIEMKGKRGKKKPSQTALSGIDIQQELPNARIVYASATGATEIQNLAYAERLGLWGRGTAFNDKQDFIQKVSQGGIAALEVIARDLKAYGLYVSRNLSMEDVKQERLEHPLRPAQKELYDDMARIWQGVFENITSVIEDLTEGGGAQKSAVNAQFYGALQRFFNQVLNSLQMPSVLDAMEDDLKAGHSPVLQIVNTNKATLDRALENRKEDEELEDLDVTPFEILVKFVDKSFPTVQYEEYTDENGTTRTRPVKDSDGNLVHNAEAIARKKEILQKLENMKAAVPLGPLDLVLERFGPDKVAELTGRNRRFKFNKDGTRSIEKMNNSFRSKELKAFHDDKKQIAIFSDAAGTGIDIHAGKAFKNQRLRRHYLIQPGWRADNAIQGLGRTHRSFQAQAPEYILVNTDVVGQKRFITTIAKRLNQLGALTKGESKATGGDLFRPEDDITGELAHIAYGQMLHDIADQKVTGWSLQKFADRTGLKVVNQQTGAIDTSETIERFLNRLLALEVDEQKIIFEVFETKLKEQGEIAAARGDVEKGVAIYKADRIVDEDERIVRKDEETGAETHYVRLTEFNKSKPQPFRNRVSEEDFIGYVQNKRSKRIWAATEGPRTVKANGTVERTARLWGVNGMQLVKRERLTDGSYDPIRTGEQAKKIWDEEVEKVPEFTVKPLHMITGVLLPVWDRVPQGEVVRLQSEAGRSHLGLIVPANKIKETLRNLGAMEKPDLTNEQAVSAILDDGKILELANGWKLERRIVGRERRIEIDGPSYRDGSTLQGEGVLIERIAYLERFFIPSGETAADVLGVVTEFREIVAVEGEEDTQAAEQDTDDSERFSVARGPRVRQKFTGDAAQVRKDLTERLKQYGIAERVGLGVVRAITETPEATGMYHPGIAIIRVVLANDVDSAWVLDHETIHALKDVGLIRQAEWSALEKAARNRKAHIRRIRNEPVYAGLTEEEVLEEVAADLFADWQLGREPARGFVRSAFQRIVNGLRAIWGAFRDNGYREATDVFERIASGEMGARDPINKNGPMGLSAEFMESSDGTDIPPAPKFASRQRPSAPVRFEDRATEERWQDSRRGAGSVETMPQRLKAWFEHIGHGFARHYINLPNGPRFADASQQFRKLEAAPQAAKEQVLRILSDLVDGMTASDLDLFTRKVVLEDLTYESEQEHDLPFGLTPESVVTELEKVDRLFVERPDLQAKFRQRKLVVRAVANQLVEAGVLHREQIKNPAYYRHQVLDYARAQVAYAKGAGKRVRTPHWARRMGSTLDINANLLEAEFEWLQKALVDVATAGTIDWVQRSDHNIRADVVAQGKAHNEAAVQEKLREDQAANPETDKQGRPTSPLTKEWRGFRQSIAYGMSIVRKHIDDGSLTDIPRQYQGAAENLSLELADDDGTLFPFLAWMMDNDKAGAAGAGLIFKAISRRRQWTKDLLGRTYVDPGDIEGLTKRFAPEGYVTWQPDEGNLLFTAKTIPEHVIDRMQRRIAEETASGGTVTAEDMQAAFNSVRSMMMVGGPKYQMVLPEEIAETLNSIRSAHDDGLIEHMMTTPLTYWKRWVLINPRRWAPYNINNLSGDIDAVIAGNPRALKKMPQAIKELYHVMIKGEAPSARYREAVERGVFDSGLTVQEIPDINYMAEFEHLINPPTLKDPGRFTLSKLMKVWRGLQRYTWFREAWLRYAAYIDYAERMESGESQESIGYGAARRDMVDAIPDPKDRAALLARELVGDYGAISHWGKDIRRKMIPFYSWMEINTKRYWRLNINAWDQGVGAGLRRTGLTGAVLGTRTTAKLYIRMALVYALVQLWNNLLFGDEEDELRTEDRVRLHLNLGRNADGEIRLIRFQGALSDFMGWLGFENAMSVFIEVQRGRASYSDILKEMAKAPINKIVSGLTPVISTPAELLLGKSLWPDVFEPRPIRDRARHAFKLFSMENEYDAAMGKPSRGYLNSLKGGTLIKHRSVGETAYGRMKELSFKFMRDFRGSEGRSDYTTDRSRALYEWRLAKRYGDAAAARKARGEMIKLGVTGKQLQASIKRAHPLGNIPIKYRRKFINTLSSREKETLELAGKWYRDTFTK